MSVATKQAGVGPLLRDWRQRRRWSQLDLALEAEVSARHLSFIETGRARPSRELILHLAAHLDVPAREQNTLLLAAGYAPVYQETALDAPAMAPVRTALEKILTSHEPFPALVVNRRWELVSANQPALAIMTEGVAPALLTPPVNAMRVALHPAGLAPRIVNFAEWSRHLLDRLRRQVVASGDPELAALRAELLDYPGVAADPATHGDAAGLLFVPLVLRGQDGQHAHFFSTVTTFGSGLDITLAELTVESFYPADAATAALLGVRTRSSDSAGN